MNNLPVLNDSFQVEIGDKFILRLNGLPYKAVPDENSSCAGCALDGETNISLCANSPRCTEANCIYVPLDVEGASQ